MKVRTKTKWEQFKADTIANGIYQSENVRAGCLRNHFDFWKSITSDSDLLSLVLGCTIQIENEIVQTEIPEAYNFPPQAKCSKLMQKLRK